MDQSGNIGPMTSEQIAAVYGDDAKAKHDALQRMLDNNGRIPIPKEDEPRVKKMNRKARRRWHAKQRKGK